LGDPHDAMGDCLVANHDCVDIVISHQGRDCDDDSTEMSRLLPYLGELGGFVREIRHVGLSLVELEIGEIDTAVRHVGKGAIRLTPVSATRSVDPWPPDAPASPGP
jgi:hypothetical protein